MGGSKKAANPPFGSPMAVTPNGPEHKVTWLSAGLGITDHPR